MDLETKKLSGTALAEETYVQLQSRIDQLKQKNVTPGLAVIIVGDRVDSATYVRMKRKKCDKLGIHNIQHTLPDDTPQQTIIDIIQQINKDPKIHGILIQLPLPKHINESEVLNTVSLSKDVDGFHQKNVSLLALNQNPVFVPCTPDGCLKLIKSVQNDITGLHAVVVGRSRIVGLPMALLLLQNNTTVTICHSRTKPEELPNIIGKADILVAACGRPEMIKGDWVKEGCIIVDVGINSVDDATSSKGYRLVGDVEYHTAFSKAKAITPVPGGVGPMTIGMLMEHTVRSAELSIQ